MHKMNKKIFVFLPFLATTCLVGCGGKSTSSSEVIKDFYLVEFNYNTEAKNDAYLNVVVNKGQVLDQPKDPNLKDLVFEGWFSDKECTSEYKRWGLEIDKDMILYAKWSSFADLDPVTSIEKFSEVLAPLSSNAVTVSQELTATFAYPALAEQVFMVEDKYVYKRYKDITTKDYLYLDEDGSYKSYGQEQFYYTDTMFWSIFKSYDPDVQDESQSSRFQKDKVESFLSIDFTNMFGSIREKLIYYLEHPDTYVIGDTFEYDFTGNYTVLANGVEQYDWTENCYAASYSEDLMTYAINQYEYSFGIQIRNGKISMAHIIDNYNVIVGEDFYYMSTEEQTLEFTYTNTDFPTFTGEKFTA